MSALINSFFRILALTRKELLAILKDPRSRVTLFLPPILQSLLFGYAASYDLNNVPYAVLDQDRGAASLDLAWVAAGRFDAYWERDLSPWDMAAGIILVREAGGFVSDLDGGDLIFAKRQIAAGNETMHGELLKLLKEAGREAGKEAIRAAAP